MGSAGQAQTEGDDLPHRGPPLKAARGHHLGHGLSSCEVGTQTTTERFGVGQKGSRDRTQHLHLLHMTAAGSAQIAQGFPTQHLQQHILDKGGPVAHAIRETGHRRTSQFREIVNKPGQDLG